MPNLYVIAGCNGAGKTTASYAVLPEMLECKEFVNADEIAKGLSPFNPGSVAIEAGRLMLRRIHELIDRRFCVRNDFGYAFVCESDPNRSKQGILCVAGLFLAEFAGTGRRQGTDAGGSGRA